MLQFKYLISEDGKTASLGRIAFWIFSIVFLVKFILSNQDIPNNFLLAYLSIVAYNFGKKTIRILELRSNIPNMNNSQNQTLNQDIKLRSKIH